MNLNISRPNSLPDADARVEEIGALVAVVQSWIQHFDGLARVELIERHLIKAVFPKEMQKIFGHWKF